MTRRQPPHQEPFRISRVVPWDPDPRYGDRDYELCDNPDCQDPEKAGQIVPRRRATGWAIVALTGTRTATPEAVVRINLCDGCARALGIARGVAMADPTLRPDVAEAARAAGGAR